MTRRGWFSDIDRDAAPTDGYLWQPYNRWVAGDSVAQPLNPGRYP